LRIADCGLKTDRQNPQIHNPQFAIRNRLLRNRLFRNSWFLLPPRSAALTLWLQSSKRNSRLSSEVNPTA